MFEGLKKRRRKYKNYREKVNRAMRKEISTSHEIVYVCQRSARRIIFGLGVCAFLLLFGMALALAPLFVADHAALENLIENRLGIDIEEWEVMENAAYDDVYSNPVVRYGGLGFISAGLAILFIFMALAFLDDRKVSKLEAKLIKKK